MYYVMRASAPSLLRESTDSLIQRIEALWSHFQRLCSDWWINIFQIYTPAFFNYMQALKYNGFFEDCKPSAASTAYILTKHSYYTF